MTAALCNMSTNEIMGFLQENMVTREELDLKFDEKLGKQKREITEELLNEVQKMLNRMKLDLVDSIDDTLGDLRADQILLMRKEDRKLIVLVGLLQKQNVITTEAADEIMALDPFSR